MSDSVMPRLTVAVAVGEVIIKDGLADAVRAGHPWQDPRLTSAMGVREFDEPTLHQQQKGHQRTNAAERRRDALGTGRPASEQRNSDSAAPMQAIQSTHASMSAARRFFGCLVAGTVAGTR